MNPNSQKGAPQQRFSTSTLAGEEIVPWLAAEGELAYSPSSPPERDYFFQYSDLLMSPQDLGCGDENGMSRS